MKKYFISIVIIFNTLLNYAQQPEMRIQQTTDWGDYKKGQFRFSPDNRMFLTIGKNDFHLWDFQSGRLIRTFTGHKDCVNTVDFSDDGYYLVSASYDGTIIIWDINTGKAIRSTKFIDDKVPETSQPKFNIGFARFLEVDSLIAFASNYEMGILNINSFKIIKSIPYYTYSIDISSDRKLIAISYTDYVNSFIQILNSSDLSLHTSIKTEGIDVIREFAFSKSGKYLAGIYQDNAGNLHTAIWKSASGEILQKMTDYKHTSNLIFTNVDKLLFTGQDKGNKGTYEKEVIIWDFLSGKKVMINFDFLSEEKILAFPEMLNVCPDGKNLLIKSKSSKEFIICDMNTSEVKRNIPFTFEYSSTTAFDIINKYTNYPWEKLNPDKFNEVSDYNSDTTIYVHAIIANLEEPDTKKFAALMGESLPRLKFTYVNRNINKLYPLDYYGYPDHISISNDYKVLLSGLFYKNNSKKFGNDFKIILYDININKVIFTRTANDINAIGMNDVGSKKTGLYGEDMGQAKSIISKDGKKIIFCSGNKLWSYDYLNKNKILFKDQPEGRIEKMFYVNNDQFLTYGEDGNAKLWNDKTLKLINTYSFNDVIWSAKLEMNGEYLLINGVNISGIWNFKTGTPIIKFCDVGVDDYIIYTSDNYYMCSKDATKYVHFVFGKKIVLFDQFDLKYNRPDLVLKQLPNVDTDLIKAYYQAYLKRLKKLNFSEEMLSSEFHVPEINITNKEDIKYNYTENNIILNIKATDSIYKLNRINVWVNNVPIFGVNGINLSHMQTYVTNKDITIELSKGKNTIQVSCLNEKGVESLKESIEIIYQPKTYKKPDLYIVAIGASEYQNSQWNLSYAAKDANDFAELFNSQKNYYENIYVNKLINQEVTVKNIRRIKQKLLLSHVDDIVMIFYAGHGLLDDSLDYYIATYNINFNKPSSNGLKYEDLDVLLDSIPARNKALFIDACHSGEVDKESQELVTENIVEKDIVFRGIKPRGYNSISRISYNNSFELMKEMFADLRKGTGAVVVSSAGGGEFAFEGENWKNGVFTYSMLNGIKTFTADKNRDNKITVSELQDYIMNQVQELTKGKQKPTMRQGNIDNDFVIWSK